MNRLLTISATVAMLALPGAALADKPTDKPDKGPRTETPAPKGNAYGKHCQGESKKHVKGEKGTAFSRCVKAAKLAAEDPATTPKEACKSLSKKHVKGEKGTPYSRCVVAAAQAEKDAEADTTA